MLRYVSTYNHKPMSMHVYTSSYCRSEYTRLVCQYVEDTKSRGHTTKPRTQTVNSTLTLPCDERYVLPKVYNIARLLSISIYVAAATY